MTRWNGREPHYRRHSSEKLVMDRLGRRYHRAEPSPDGTSLTELAAGVVTLLIAFVAIFWALPVIFTAAQP